MDKIKMSLTRSFGGENIAMTSEVGSVQDIKTFQDFFSAGVLGHYEDILKRNLPEKALSSKYAIETSDSANKQALALAEQSKALKLLNDEADKLAKEQIRANKLMNR
jgi:hypothetical protein